MPVLKSDVTINHLADIARDVTVAAINNAGNIGTPGRTTTADLGAAAGKMFAETFKQIANTEY